MNQDYPVKILESRLENLKEKITEEDFLKGRGLGNEVPFWIFDYSPRNEILVRNTITKIISNAKKQSCNIGEINLYQLSLDILKKKVPLKKIIGLEKNKGSIDVLKNIKLLVKSNVLTKEIQKEMKNKKYDLIFLTGVGNVWPLLRSHSILNNLQAIDEGVTWVMFYPGEYNGNELRLFGKFKDANYYRAFRLVPQ